MDKAEKRGAAQRRAEGGRGDAARRRADAGPAHAGTAADAAGYVREQRARAIASLTLDEQLRLGEGASFWKTVALPRSGVPALTVSDGPSGLRHQPEGSLAAALGASVEATCFPSPAVVASSWDEDLARHVGAAIAQEARAHGVGVVLAPGLNIKRNPLCGRNFEYLSEDPLLAGRMGAAEVEGMQAQGVGACIKHFAANSQEYKRTSSDSVVDERTLRELYLRAFEHVVRRARPVMVMNSYNKVNGVYASDSAWLIGQVLRDEWGFDGVVVTDWGGMHDRAAAYRAGCDLMMPGPARHARAAARRALRAGELDSDLVAASATRVAALATVSAEVLAPHRGEPIDFAGHHLLAREAAEAGCVLLKNDGTLPIAPGARVALIGEMALEPRCQGAGSSHVNAPRVPGMREVAPTWTFARGYRASDGSTSPALLAAAVRVARAADVAVVVLGLPESWEGEGFDRASLDLPAGMNELVERVAEANPRCAVVLQTGSAVACPWVDEVAAILWCGLAGEAVSEAAVRVLTGAAEPAGRLAETWPAAYRHVPGSGWWGAPHRQAQYREGLYVGYRYHVSSGVPPLFAFGHGLGYTRFAYGALRMPAADAEGADPRAGLAVEVELANVGSRTGSEVVQVYAEPREAEGPYRPRRVLAGFAKVALAPGERARVRVELDPRAFMVWDGGWRVAGGTYAVRAGRSSADLRCEAPLAVRGERPATPVGQSSTWYAHPQGLPTARDFAWLYGREVPLERRPRKGTYTEEDSFLDLAETSLAARGMVALLAVLLCFSGRPGSAAWRMAFASSADAAQFGVVNASGGALPACWVRALLRLANGRGA